MSQSVSKLKELLFDRENATLTELQTRILQIAASEQLSRQQLGLSLKDMIASEAATRDELAKRFEALFNRTGTDEKLRESVAEVLDGAFKDAEVKRHDQLTRAVAPVVVKTIKTELRNSQDEMVEALYPITGRLVKSYVASAMRDLADRINRRLSVGGNPALLRLRSLMTGRSIAELAMTDVQRLEVVELFLIRRGSGELLQHWPDDSKADHGLSNFNIHLSGVLTAINDFAAQALKDDGGSLRSFSLDDFHMYLRASPGYLLAAKCRGSAPAGVEQILDEEFLGLLERSRQAGGELLTVPPTLDPLAESLERQLDDKQRQLAAAPATNPLKVLTIAVAIPLILFAGWTAFTNWETARIRDIAGHIVESAAELKGYPVQLDVAQRGRAVTLAGLTPTAASKADILAKLRGALPDIPVYDQLAVLPNSAADLESQISRVHREVANLENEVLRSSVRRSLARTAKYLESAMPDLRRLELALLDQSSRNTAQLSGSVLESAAAEVRQLHARVASGPFDVAQLSAVSAPVHALTQQLRQASGELASLLSKGSVGSAAAHGDAAPSDVLESAEELSLAAIQAATTVIAVAQSAQVRPAPPPPPAPMVPAAPSAIEKLERWLRLNAIFFADGIDYRSMAAADSTLDAAAALIKDAGVLVRIVGYTDDRGGQARNGSLAQQRAQRVADALTERGVRRQLLVAVGRPTGPDISPVIGPQSANRRVEFEIGFFNEAIEAQ